MNQCVSEEMFALIFRTHFEVTGMQIELWTPSLPMIIISHDSQKKQAQSTVVWDNAGEGSFDIPEELQWGQVMMYSLEKFKIYTFVQKRKNHNLQIENSNSIK